GGAPRSPPGAAGGRERVTRSPGPQILPASGFHELAPARVEAALVVLARRTGHDADPAGELEAVVLEAVRRAAQAHLVVVGILAGDGAAAGRVCVVPVLHVVLLGQARRARIADVVVAEEVLHLGRRIGVDEVPAPHFRLMRAAGMPGGDGSRLTGEGRGIGEEQAGPD